MTNGRRRLSVNSLFGSLDEGEFEGGSTELKERLSPATHLVDGKRESLAAQMRHRILSGDGGATYVVGVTDDEGVAGIPHEAMVETIDVLEHVADDIGAEIVSVETWETDRGLVGTVSIVDSTREMVDDDHLVIGTAGHVDHGKSTLVGALITGDRDDGDGSMRRFLDVQPHEEERGLSADLSFGVYGFNYDEATTFPDGDRERISWRPVRLGNPNRDEDRAKLVESSDRVISFVDTVGHEPWLRTTIRGLLGQEIDYGMLTVAANDGPTKTTREHLGILLATDIPTIVAITKADMVDEERVELTKTSIERLLRDVGKTPLDVDRAGVDAAIEETSTDVVPIFETSAVTGDGLDELDQFFASAPTTMTSNGDDPLRLYVDRDYSITGVGPVISGTIKSGTIETSDQLKLGPMADGSFRPVEVRSIEQHYHRVEAASSGRIVGVALKGVETGEIERGMVLIDEDEEERAVRSFEADVTVLNHPTNISSGYEPIVHLETIQEAARFYPELHQLLPGSTGRVTVEFRFNPYFVEEGQTFVFREGSSKGVGTVVEVNDES